MVLPAGYYIDTMHNSSNGITNKNNTESGLYSNFDFDTPENPLVELEAVVNIILQKDN